MDNRIIYLMSLKKANLMRMKDLLLTNDTEELKRTKHSYELIDRELNRINNSLDKPYPLYALKIDDLFIKENKENCIPKKSMIGTFKTLEQEENELLPKIYDDKIFTNEVPKLQEEKMIIKEDNNQSEYLDQMYSLYD